MKAEIFWARCPEGHGWHWHIQGDNVIHGPFGTMLEAYVDYAATKEMAEARARSPGFCVNLQR